MGLTVKTGIQIWYRNNMIFDYKKYVDKFHQWHLLYRTEIVCFVCGFLLGVIII